MDLSLPEIDGWQAARILKNDAGTRGIPVVAHLPEHHPSFARE
jgi:CheY-like chemotaxis protein